MQLAGESQRNELLQQDFEEKAVLLRELQFDKKKHENVLKGEISKREAMVATRDQEILFLK